MKVALEYGLSDLPLIKIAARKARHFLVFVPRCVYLPLFRAFSLQYESLYVVPVRRKTLSARGSEVDIGPGAGAEMLRYASVSKET